MPREKMGVNAAGWLPTNAAVPLQTVFRRIFDTGAVKMVATFAFFLDNVWYQHKSMTGESGKSVSLLLLVGSQPVSGSGYEMTCLGRFSSSSMYSYLPPHCLAMTAVL